MTTQTSDKTVRARPGSLRALGDAEPPTVITLAGEPYQRITVFKHDTFAGTALYEGPAGKVIAKFNRAAPALGVPMQWLGRRLARRETRVLERLQGIEGIPRSAGPVEIDGQPAPYVTAHHFIEGHPLAEHQRVDDAFFPTLVQMLEQVHARGVAHVDLNKRENIIVGHDGKPNLIDYQIHYALPHRFPGNNPLARLILRMLQRSDHYHLLKHRIHHRPDQLPEDMRNLDALRPWWIRFWRQIATPWRISRRWVLVKLRIRSGDGRAHSEHEPEVAFRPRSSSTDEQS
ncbi:hypothetical protein ACERK3_10050 [Phycisphaerales bacterium AB-hyl4]|uniref:RIO1 family protein n=1 Tax=Natronomicrosphaera hydrolytica TaxID=3242702 RepID=A0ABV4U4V9_9BACT